MINRIKKSIYYLLIAVFTISILSADAYALKDSEIPNISKIKALVKEYRNSGQWARDLEDCSMRAISLLEKERDVKAKQAIVFDIDETTIDNYEYYLKNDFGFVLEQWDKWMNYPGGGRIYASYRIYEKANELGIKVFFITGRSEKSRSITETLLKREGYARYEKLIMRGANKLKITAKAYKSMEREKVENEGYEIILNVGDQYSDLLGGHCKHAVKLPNPMYCLE